MVIYLYLSFYKLNQILASGKSYLSLYGILRNSDGSAIAGAMWGIYTTDTIKYKYPILAESSSNVGIIVLDVSNYKSYATIY